MCCFTYGFGARMKPTNLNIIECSEYDAYDDNLIVGGGRGKFSTCPEDAVTAHQWVSGNNNAQQLKTFYIFETVCIIPHCHLLLSFHPTRRSPRSTTHPSCTKRMEDKMGSSK